MDESDLLEISFRVRVKPNCKDAPLLRYLKKIKPAKRKQMILQALRICYLVEAVKEDSEISRVDAKKLLANLERTLFDQSIRIEGEDFTATMSIFKDSSEISQKIYRAE